MDVFWHSDLSLWSIHLVGIKFFYSLTLSLFLSFSLSHTRSLSLSLFHFLTYSLSLSTLSHSHIIIIYKDFIFTFLSNFLSPLQTPLHIASRFGFALIVKSLLNFGANVNDKDVWREEERWMERKESKNGCGCGCGCMSLYEGNVVFLHINSPMFSRTHTGKCE